jgi:hypothetical protein
VLGAISDGLEGRVDMHTVHNARVQLLATALNNVALAFIVAGFVAPVVSGQLQRADRALVTFAWIAFGVGLHFSAQMVLGRLRQ